MPKYDAIVAHIFSNHYRDGLKRVSFDRNELIVQVMQDIEFCQQNFQIFCASL